MKSIIHYKDGMRWANNFIHEVGPLCDRIEIAGSLRRKKEMVGDIEIVCIPKMIKFTNLLDEQIEIPGTDNLSLMYFLNKNGPHFKQVRLGAYSIDVFITTPAQWGVIFTLRTGSADFSKWLVTARSHGGGCPSYLRVEDGRITDGKTYLSTPEEMDVFEALSIPYIDPSKRISGNWFEWAEQERRYGVKTS